MPTKILTIMQKKGGVAKTTTSVSLAHYLALQGKKTLLVDLDPQGCCADFLGLERGPGASYFLSNSGRPQERDFARMWVVESGRPNLWVLPSDSTLGAAIKVLENRPMNAVRQAVDWLMSPTLQFEYVVIDTLPSVETTGLQTRAAWAADMVVVVCETAYASLSTLPATLETIRILEDLTGEQRWNGATLGILPTLLGRSSDSQKSLEQLRQTFGDRVLDPISESAYMRSATAEGKSIFEYRPESPVAHQYRALGKQVMRY